MDTVKVSKRRLRLIRQKKKRAIRHPLWHIDLESRQHHEFIAVAIDRIDSGAFDISQFLANA